MTDWGQNPALASPQLPQLQLQPPFIAHQCPHPNGALLAPSSGTDISHLSNTL